MPYFRLLFLSFAFVLGISCKAHTPESAPEAAAEKAPEAPAPKAQSASPPMAEGEGEHRFNSLPWSHMVIDGKPAGRTGKSIRLKAGVHTVALTASDGKTHVMKVEIQSGKVLKVCWDFQREAACER